MYIRFVLFDAGVALTQANSRNNKASTRHHSKITSKISGNSHKIATGMMFSKLLKQTNTLLGSPN